MKRVFLALTLVAGLVWAPTTAFGGDDDVVKRGSCSGSTTWKLKISPEDGRLEVEYEVDQNKNGKQWRVRMFHNGTRFFSGIKTTQPPSGSFEVRRVVDDTAGTDAIRARARNLQTDELCVGRVSF